MSVKEIALIIFFTVISVVLLIITLAGATIRQLLEWNLLLSFI